MKLETETTHDGHIDDPTLAIPPFRDRNAQTVKRLIRTGDAEMAGLMAKLLAGDCRRAYVSASEAVSK